MGEGLDVVDEGRPGSLVASFMIVTATVLVFTVWRRRDKTQLANQPETSAAQTSTSTSHTSPSAEASDA